MPGPRREVTLVGSFSWNSYVPNEQIRFSRKDSFFPLNALNNTRGNPLPAINLKKSLEDLI